MRYLSEILDEEEIVSWRAGDCILINSPTGSGKSSFVLTKLLPQAIEAGKHLLYLCSRKILSEQFTVTSRTQLSEFFADCKDLLEAQMQAIYIVTYQYCERTTQFPRIQKLL